MIILILLYLYYRYRTDGSIFKNLNERIKNMGFNHIDNYYASRYQEKSGISYSQFITDKGYHGEGQNYYILENLNHYGKTLVNLYIPTEDVKNEHINQLKDN